MNDDDIIQEISLNWHLMCPVYIPGAEIHSPFYDRTMNLNPYDSWYLRYLREEENGDNKV
jgi:hypothetical protein